MLHNETDTDMRLSHTAEVIKDELFIVLEGHLTAVTINAVKFDIRELVQQALEKHEIKSLVLDLARIKTIDSYGIKEILSANTISLANKLDFRVEVAPHPVTHTLMLCKLDRIIDVKEVMPR